MFRILAALLLCSAVGCGGYDMAPVKGKVSFAGRPLTSGTIVFSPSEADEDAPNSTGEIQPDGTFELEDGAMVGKHTVTVVGNAAAFEEDSEEEEDNESPFAAVTPVTATATVASGDNELSIELTRSAPPGPVARR
jgi:hypothetical protein